MVQDINKLVVFGSQFFGVLVVFFSVWAQRPILHTPRPPSTKPGIVADSNGDFFARLWDDPLELAARQPKNPNPTDPRIEKMSPSPTPASSPSTLASLPPAHSCSSVLSATAKRPHTRASRTPRHAGSSTISSIVSEPPALASPTPVLASPTPVPAPTPSQPSPDSNNLVIWNILDASSVAEIRERRLRIRYAVVSAVLTAGYLPLRESVLTRLDRESAEAPAEPHSMEVLGSFETFQRDGGKSVTLVWTEKVKSIDQETIESIRRRVAERNNDSREPKIHILHHGSSEDLVKYAAASTKAPGEICFMRATISGDEYKNSRGIISDDKLVDALVNELALRIPALAVTADERGKGPLILVITESDTQYSRAIFDQLKQKFAAKKTKVELLSCSYLRGLDGQSEKVSTTTEPSKPASNSAIDSILQGRGIAEKSSGTSQFDYLRRLAIRLEFERKRWKGRDVVAVGILGSDIYDKLLVLQAVRAALPSAIFFTTDLDALYLEEESQQYTRYLVVASADGLNVRENLPPMRDSYQTVLAKKVLTLLQKRAMAPERVFEIAAGRSIPLDAPSDTWNFVLRLLSKWYVSPLIFCLALGNAFLILAAIFTLHGEQPKGAPMSASARTFVYTEVIVAFGTIGCLLIRLVVSKAPLLGEPVALGISIWPSVMIRLLAFGVAILLLLLASWSFVTERQGIKAKLLKALPENFNLPLPQGLVEEGRRLFRNLLHKEETPALDQGFRVYLVKFFGSEKRPGWRAVWRNKRFQRIVIGSLVYFAISALLFWKWPPSVPGRGALALLTEKTILALGVSLYIIHLVFCLELHLGAFRLLRALRLSCERATWQIEEAGEKAKLILEASSNLTSIIGKTLLYPLTVLILIILSRLRNFDNWVMTPSLGITFLLGALGLVIASLALWLRGSRLKKAVLEKHDTLYEERESKLAKQKLEENSRLKAASLAGGNLTPGSATDTKAAALAEEKRDLRAAFAKEKGELEGIDGGVFAAWYNQPIFAAIFSAAAVFGSLSVASPLARLFSS